jgi:drug/metabolite transporter (DMT)-like permease
VKLLGAPYDLLIDSPTLIHDTMISSSQEFGNRSIGYVYVMLAAVMWASSGTAGKALFHAGMPPAHLVLIRVTLASLLVGGAFLLLSRDLFRIRITHLFHFIVLGGVIMTLVQVTYFYAISKIQVMAAVLLQYLAPILVAVFSMLFWAERCTVAKLVALTLAMGGAYLVAGGYDMNILRMNRMGILGGLAAAAAFAAYALVGEWAMQRYRPWTVVFYSFLFAAVTCNLIRSPSEVFAAGYSTGQWGLILYIVVVGTVAPFGLYFMGINKIRSTRASITATLEPIFAGCMAFLFLGEHLAGLQIVGASLVVAAVVSLQLHAEQDKLVPELVRTGNKEITKARSEESDAILE